MDIRFAFLIAHKNVSFVYHVSAL